MRSTCAALITLLPLLAACQSTPTPSEQAQGTRIYGTLTQSHGQLLLTPCASTEALIVHNPDQDGLLEHAQALLNDGHSQLFADLQALPMGESGLLHVDKLYRLQGEGGRCDEPRFAERVLIATGQEPGWFVGVSPQSLLLIRAGEESQAIPYVIEQLSDERMSISSHAQGIKLELWTSPQACFDSMSGNYYHLSAQLRLNDEQLQGCASLGGLETTP